MKILFRIVSFLEGTSYLLLLFFAVPFKYLLDDPSYVKMFGMPHGLLFVGYLILAYYIKDSMKWKKKDFAKVLFASIVPFGTFWVEKKYFAKRK
jgi:integral membrane protein